MITTCRWEKDYRGRLSDLVVEASFSDESVSLRAINEGGRRLTDISAGEHVTFTWASGPKTKLRSDNPGFDINTLLPGYYSQAHLSREEATHYSWDIRAKDSARDRFVSNTTPSSHHIPWGFCPDVTTVPALSVWGSVVLFLVLSAAVCRLRR